jgi:RNA polymerase sigma-70 factor (ECF subfamily)
MMNANDKNTETVEKYINLVYKICITRLGDFIPSSVDDACQQVFLNFISNNPVFKDTAQEKAWFIKVSVNVCNNLYKEHKRRGNVNIDLETMVDMPAFSSSNNAAADIADIMSVLPIKLRDAFYLTCIEEYTSDEAAKILKTSGAAIRMRVKRAKEILRGTYDKEDFIYER